MTARLAGEATVLREYTSQSVAAGGSEGAEQSGFKRFGLVGQLHARANTRTITALGTLTATLSAGSVQGRWPQSRSILGWNGS